MPVTTIENIAPALAPLIVAIETVETHPRNPRQGDVGAIVESIQRFGQQKPIVVQKSTGYVVAGNHLLRAALALGWRTIAANVVDMDNRQARAFMIADNRTAELGSYDQDALGAILRELAVDADLIGTGYDEEDVNRYLSDMTRDIELGEFDRDATKHERGDTQITVGEYKFTVTRTDYDEWIELLKTMIGAWDEATVKTEIRKRLGL